MSVENPDGASSAEREALRRVPSRLRHAVYRADATDADRSALDLALRALPSESFSSARATEGHPVEEMQPRDPQRTARAQSTPVTAERGSAAAGEAKPEPEPQQASSVRRPSRRMAGLAIAATVALALVGAAAWVAQDRSLHPSAHRGAAPTAAPSARSTPVAMLGEEENRQRQVVALAHLFDDVGRADLHTYLVTHYFGAVVDPATVLASVHGHGAGRHVFDLGRLADAATASGPRDDVTVLLTCDRSAAYRWTLSSPGLEHDEPTSIGASGPECFGHVVAATVRPPIGATPTRLEVIVPDGVRVLVSVVLNSGT